MFGVGPQEMVIIGLLLLVVFGPSKLPSMARDVGRFVSQARRYKDEFQSELVSGADDEPPKEDEPPEQGKTFNLTIEEGTMTPAEITVEEGDEVILWITSDSPTEVHLDGYYLSARVEPGEPMDLPFDADRPGRFAFEDERAETGLGTLIVEPRQGGKP
jgi:TatA/E family protein of Tat protein translocase